MRDTHTMHEDVHFRDVRVEAGGPEQRLAGSACHRALEHLSAVGARECPRTLGTQKLNAVSLYALPRQHVEVHIPLGAGPDISGRPWRPSSSRRAAPPRLRPVQVAAAART